MDKVLKRKIGFVKPTASKPATNSSKVVKPATKVAKSPVPPQNKPEKKVAVTSKQVVDWINKHPLFKYSVMCEQVGLDKSNFSRVLKDDQPTIRPDLLPKIETVIRKYGFQN